jgi:hypothetical protein
MGRLIRDHEVHYIHNFADNTRRRRCEYPCVLVNWLCLKCLLDGNGTLTVWFVYTVWVIVRHRNPFYTNAKMHMEDKTVWIKNKVFVYCADFVYSFPKISMQWKRHLSAPSSIQLPKRNWRELSISDQVELIKEGETLSDKYGIGNVYSGGIIKNKQSKLCSLNHYPVPKCKHVLPISNQNFIVFRCNKETKNMFTL